MCACLQDGTVTRRGEPSSFARSQYVQDLILGEHFCERSPWIMPDVQPTTTTTIRRRRPTSAGSTLLRPKRRCERPATLDLQFVILITVNNTVCKQRISI